MITAALGKIAPAIPADVQFSPEELVWQLTLDQIESNTGRIIDWVTAPASSAGSSTYCFDEQNVLYSKLRPYLNKVICPNKPGIATTELVPLRPDPDRLDRQYLCYYLRSPKFVSWVSNQVAGAKMPRVSMQTFWAHEVPLPSLKEQKRIAAILDKADAIRRKRAEAIFLADNFLESAFLDMFGDPVINPRGWPKKPLEKLLAFLTSGSRGWAKYYSDEGRPFLRIQNVGHNRLLMDDIAYVLPPDNAETRRTLVQPGDVLLSITADLGRTAVIPEGMAAAHINQHLALLRPQGIEPLYLSAFLSSPGGQTHIHALNRNGVKAGLNFSDVRSLEILLPPNSLQKCFVRLYEKHTQMLQRLSKAMTTINALFESLVQRAFRGGL